MLTIQKYLFKDEVERFLLWRSSIVVLKLLVLSGEAKAIAPLSPILGQYTLNTTDFCNKFNEETSEISEGLPIRLDFYIYLRDKEFKYKIINFSFISIIKGLYFKNVSILDFYKISLAYCYINNISMSNLKRKDVMLTIRGMLKTMQCSFLLYYE